MDPIVVKPIVRSFPGRIESFFRMGGTIKLVNALMRDARVSTLRKVCFAVALCTLLMAMIFPELVADGFLASILPFISTIIGIPLEAGVDWFTFVMLLPVLLRIFPAKVMQEHYLRIFRKQAALIEPVAFEAQVLPGAGNSSA